MEKNLLKQLSDGMSGFSKGHKLIAEYVLEHYERSAFMTAQKLGEAVGVSESTVVRFAAIAGFKGYPEFQKSLQELLRNKLTALERMELAGSAENAGELLEQVMSIDVDRIRESMSTISLSDFNGAVERIADAQSIYIIGSRSAAALASFASYYLNLMFPYVKRVVSSSASEMFEQIMRIDKNDVILGFSYPRYSSQTVTALKFAHDKGAGVVAFTDSANSPLAEYADCLLLARSDMASFVDSLVAPFSLLNALIVAVSVRKKDMATKSFKNLEEIWDKYNAFDSTVDV